ncbi:MAG: adenylate/guanylate cyclase domain-containing protein [Planctomycetota bacterium]|nr:adenylate/guanylate cyclase domain-containing protein [Planctomycetota bacterium]
MGLKLLVKQGDRSIAFYDLPADQELIVGASPAVDCPVPGERYLSRRHVVLRAGGADVEVSRVKDARNPVLFKGERNDSFRMRAGDHFVVGSTAFCVVGSAVGRGDRGAEAAPSEQFSIGVEELRAPSDSGSRFLLLDLMELPEILRSQSRQDFFVYACGLLRKTAQAGWAGVITLRDDDPIILAEDASIDRQEERPLSRSLIDEAIGQAPSPLSYSWSRDGGADVKATQQAGIDWTVACAVPVPGEAPVVFYIAGSDSRTAERTGRPHEPMSLRDIAKMIGLVTDMIGRSMSLQKMEEWQSRLGRFFSKQLASKILESDASETLAPKISEATVMFFDIRGFSLRTEGNVNRMLDYQAELKQVMSAVTQSVFDHDGVVLHYLGDGMMACWNVPYPTENHAELAALAALDMVEQIRQVTEDWECGVALGVGDVVCGSLGSEQVYSYSILGPVVNQTSRVEGITKEVGEPVLVTEDVAMRLPAGKLLHRRVAHFLPAGMAMPVNLYSVHSIPEDTAERTKLEERFALHAEALAAFEKGDWEDTERLLHPIVPVDAAAKYVYKLALQGKPPRDWKGVIELLSK